LALGPHWSSHKSETLKVTANLLDVGHICSLPSYLWNIKSFMLQYYRKIFSNEFNGKKCIQIGLKIKKKPLIILIGVDIFWSLLTLLSGKLYELDQIYLKTQTGNVVRNLTKNLTSKLDLKWKFKILGAGLLWSPNTCIYETVRATTNL
jgi:hypothetical protein